MNSLQAIPILEVTPHEVIVWKPPQLVSELPRDPSADSLVQRLAGQGFDVLKLAHRLDAPSCGVMVIARSKEAAAHYSSEIAAKRWHKLYVAAVASPFADAGKLLGEHRAYLASDRFQARVVRSGGKPSSLGVIHAAPANDGRSSHLLIRLHTGRFHQIRVMLANLGAPLLGDSRYGGPDGDFYLEHVCLAARPFAEEGVRVWRAPEFVDRPRWSPSLAEAVSAEVAALNQS